MDDLYDFTETAFHLPVTFPVSDKFTAYILRYVTLPYINETTDGPSGVYTAEIFGVFVKR